MSAEVLEDPPDRSTPSDNVSILPRSAGGDTLAEDKNEQAKQKTKMRRGGEDPQAGSAKSTNVARTARKA